MRNQETTKHDYGHALLVAGAYGRCGCAILAARAALRSGCGLVSVHLPGRCVDPMQAAFPEAMVSIDADDRRFTSLPQHLQRYNAVAVGPGLGTEQPTAKALHALLVARGGRGVVIDADALNILAQHPDWLPLCRGAILTPHEREYQRLFADADPAAMASMYGVVIVKKSHCTYVYAPDGRLYVNQTGNAGMATAGSGDVLTGILAGLMAQGGRTSFEVACLGVHLHGACGDWCIRHQSEASLIASDLVDALCHVDIESIVDTCIPLTEKYSLFAPLRDEAVFSNITLDS